MKKLFTTFIGLCVFGFLPLFSQTTFTDNFNTDHNYLTSGVTGTGWDSILLNQGYITASDTTIAELTALNTIDSTDVLRFASVHSHWEGNLDNGIILYKEVVADSNFEMQIKIVGGMPSQDTANPVIPYMMPGLMARVVADTAWHADSTGFVAVQAFDQYSAGMQVRSSWGIATRGSEEHWTAVDESFDDLTVSLYPYLKLAKEGNVFTGSVSKDGVTWFSLGDYERPDMAGYNLIIGIINPTYTDVEGEVTFDDFSATGHFIKGGSAIRNNIAENLKIYYNRNLSEICFTSTASNNIINSVSIIGIDGRMVKQVNNLMGNSINVSEVNQGLYIVVAKTADGLKHSQKVLIY